MGMGFYFAMTTLGMGGITNLAPGPDGLLPEAHAWFLVRSPFDHWSNIGILCAVPGALAGAGAFDRCSNMGEEGRPPDLTGACG